jgi:hypothetical protein
MSNASFLWLPGLNPAAAVYHLPALLLAAQAVVEAFAIDLPCAGLTNKKG